MIDDFFSLEIEQNGFCQDCPARSECKGSSGPDDCNRIQKEFYEKYGAP